MNEEQNAPEQVQQAPPKWRRLGRALVGLVSLVISVIAATTIVSFVLGLAWNVFAPSVFGVSTLTMIQSIGVVVFLVVVGSVLLAPSLAAAVADRKKQIPNVTLSPESVIIISKADADDLGLALNPVLLAHAPQGGKGNGPGPN